MLLIDYRLAPEHPHPAAVDDATAAYRWLLAQGLAPGNLAISGDSAGGGLTVATLLALRDAGDPLPACAVPMSPWVDMEPVGRVVHDPVRRSIPMVSAVGLKQMADWYLAGQDQKTPLASPLHADLSGLPPLLVQVGDHEVLLDDSVRLVERAKAAGVDATVRGRRGVLPRVPGLPRARGRRGHRPAGRLRRAATSAAERDHRLHRRRLRREPRPGRLGVGRARRRASRAAPTRRRPTSAWRSRPCSRRSRTSTARSRS